MLMSPLFAFLVLIPLETTFPGTSRFLCFPSYSAPSWSRKRTKRRLRLSGNNLEACIVVPSMESLFSAYPCFKFSQLCLSPFVFLDLPGFFFKSQVHGLRPALDSIELTKQADELSPMFSSVLAESEVRCSLLESCCWSAGSFLTEPVRPFFSVFPRSARASFLSQ